MTLRVHRLALLLLPILAPLLLRAASTESLAAIPRPTCKAGVEHTVTYRISEILWLEPNSPETPGYTVSKGFIDCTERPLPSRPSSLVQE